MVNRREFLGFTVGAGATLALTPELLRALQQSGGTLMQRAIPSTGEMLPVIGLQFGNDLPPDHAALTEVLRTLVGNGGRVLDTVHQTAAGAEEVTATIVNELAIQNRIFLATRGSPPPEERGGFVALMTAAGVWPQPGPAAVRAQIERSLARFKVPKIDLVMVNPANTDSKHLTVLKQMKQEGRARYIGAQVVSDHQYAALEAVMRNEPIDFVGVDYSIDNRRVVEQTILPLAQERKLGVLAFFPFGQGGMGGLFRRAGTRPLPEWAAEFDARTWSQFFLKYVVSHPAVTVVRTGTSKPKHMLENIGGGIGRLPSEATRQRMIELVDAWPPVGPPGR
jgi:aryl-alcohol dehydrogenase-like predicted oxidoreductase